MTLLETIKADQIAARKAKNNVASMILTLLIGESEKIGKNDGNRLTTDVEVQGVIKKLVKGIDECLAAYKTRDDKDDDIARSEMEKEVIIKYLPTQLTSDQLTNIIKEIIDSNEDINMGLVMKTLNNSYQGLYNGKEASGIVKKLLSKG